MKRIIRTQKKSPLAPRNTVALSPLLRRGAVHEPLGSRAQRTAAKRSWRRQEERDHNL